VKTNKKSSLFAMPEEAGIELCRVFGLAINNISMYGMEHSVTATSVAAAYDELLGKLDGFGEIEFVLADVGLMINGAIIKTERTTGQLFVTQLNKLGVHDFALKSPLDRFEFNRFMSILASPPGSEEVADGFESAISKAGFKCIRVTNVSYARVDENEDLSKMNFEDPSCESEEGDAKVADGSKSFNLDVGGGANTFDLDFDMGFDEIGFEGTSAHMETERENNLVADAKSYLKEKKFTEDLQKRLIEKIRGTVSSPEDRKRLRAQLLDSGFSRNDWGDLLLVSGCIAADRDDAGAAETLLRIRREVDALAAHGETIAAGKSSDAMSSILDTIGQEVAKLSSQTKGHVTTLVGKVDADRETIARVEQDARARGIGLNLSRDELLESLAEINQELAQSLTVISSVTDILTNENIGAMNPAQQDILKVAADGIEKIHKLAAYMGNLSGIPAGLSPDREIINEAYGN